MDSKKISVVIPTYNRKDYLRGCLDSLYKQTYSNFEIIVVDDGSNDGTHESIANDIISKRVKYYIQANKGPGAARNLGIDKSKGSLIAFTDDDCRPDKDWLKNAAQVLRDPDIAGVEGRTISDSEITPTSLPIINEYGGKRSTCNIIYKKYILQDIGGFDERFVFSGEDADIAFRAEKKGKIVFSRSVVVTHPVKHYSIKGFIRHHIKVKRTYWQVLGAKTYNKRYSWETLIHYPLYAAFLFFVFNSNFYTFLILGYSYVMSIILYDLYLTKGRMMDIFRHKVKLVQLIAVGWVIILADVIFRIAGIIQYRRIVL